MINGIWEIFCESAMHRSIERRKEHIRGHFGFHSERGIEIVIFCYGGRYLSFNARNLSHFGSALGVLVRQVASR